MSKLISGEDVIDWLKVSPIELYSGFVSKGLQPRDNAGRPIFPYDVFKHMIRSWQKECRDHEETACQLTELDREEIYANHICPLKAKINNVVKILGSLNGNNWVDFEMPESRDMENMVLWCLTKAWYHEDQVKTVDAEITPAPVDTPHSHKQPLKEAAQTASKELPRDRHRRQTRAVAKKLWDKHPSMSRPEMAQHPDVMEASKKTNGNYYSDKIVKSWIKDLNPNPPLKGRPKKKSG